MVYDSSGLSFWEFKNRWTVLGPVLVKYGWKIGLDWNFQHYPGIVEVVKFTFPHQEQELQEYREYTEGVEEWKFNYRKQIQVIYLKANGKKETSEFGQRFDNGST